MRSLHAVTVLIFFLLITMAGCSSRALPSVDGFIVYIQNDTGADIHTVQLHYWLSGEVLGSMGGCHADNSPIKPGTSMEFQFLPEDFPKNADLSSFSLQIQALDENENPSTAAISLSVPAAYGRIYEISLSGSRARLIP